MAVTKKSQAEIREHLIDAGVSNLKEFGYPNVDKVNILTDPIYSAFFEGMLRDNVGSNTSINEAIRDLRLKISSLKNTGLV